MRSRAPVSLALAGLTLLAALPVGVAIAAASAVRSTGSSDSVGQTGTRLRPGAPVPARYLAWVLRAGSVCPQIGPAQIAAQIDLESGWRPGAYADSGEVPARGIAQFTDATWATWGADADGDGRSAPTDPEDAIVAQGRLMCDLVAWTQRGLTTGTLRGTVLDLAWAAYFCGRACIQRAGQVPAAGLAHDYPQQIRTRLPRYSAPAAGGVGGWVMPIRGYRLSSGFGQRWGVLHAGQDFAAPAGTPIYAAAAGTVTEAGCTSPRCDVPGSTSMRGCGWTVAIADGGGIATRYCHAIRLATGLAPGARVAAGQVIAWVGSTGNSTGPHLHFEVRRRGAIPTDPLPFLRAAGLTP